MILGELHIGAVAAGDAAGVVRERRAGARGGVAAAYAGAPRGRARDHQPRARLQGQAEAL